MRIISNRRDIEVRGDDGASWGIDLYPDKSIRLYAYGPTYRDQDNRDANESVEVDLIPEDVGDFVATVQAWFEQLR